VSAAAGFKLGIVFEGLDFQRDPLPISEVDRNFRYLVDHYAGNPVFDIFGKPVVVWAGTWRYKTEQMRSITGTYGSRLSILASEKQLASYEAVAGLFDGNAYYWSSADPLTTPGYQEKLSAFSSAVHGHGGLWIAPAAPGFDARLVGGSRVVPRRNGETLRLEMNAATSSSPDAVGLISWNEYSENSMVEPSRAYGSAALKVIAGMVHADPAAVPTLDSNAPSGFHAGPSQFAILGILVVILLGSAGAITLRTFRGPQ
jgi:hypothetical protein